MSCEPIIQQEKEGVREHMEVQEAEMREPGVKVEEGVKMEVVGDENFVQEVRIDGETLFSLPPEMKQAQDNLVYRERKTRWGERMIKRCKIQEDAVFNPLEMLYHGNSLLPITQYGQAEIEIKLALCSDGKKRKSKWHHEIEKTFTPPMLNYISPNISLDQVEYMLRLYRLDQLTARMNEYQAEDSDLRSPSPEPIYDKDGKRINTREVRKRDALHRERISLIEDCMKMRKSFVPPEDYKPLKKFKKIYLTEAAINDTRANYIGKIIGPQGTTQKLIEKRSGCRIAVRGRGANKAHKDIFQNYEPLHIIVVADTDDSLDKGVDEVQKILNGEEDDELKELLQGFGKEVMGFFNQNFCDNCQQEGHRTWACPFQTKIAAHVKCSICGQGSHPTSDCPEKQAYLKKQQNDQIAMLFESQYSQFKDDLVVKKKPIGGTSFITDFTKKDILAIGQGEPRTEQKVLPASRDAPSKAVKKVVEEAIITNELPKFEDD